MIKLMSLLREVENSSIIENPNFKKWFGNSRVVDNNGKPLMVYHGTTKNFKSFNSNRPFDRVGIYFTDKPNIANISSLGKQEDGANTVPVYLSIKNPKKVEWRDIIQIDSKMAELYKKDGFDGLIATRPDGSKEFVVFDPTQIKSAIGNTGSFNSHDSDITKENL